MYKNFDEKVETVFGLEHLKNMKLNALLDNGVVENLQVDEKGSVQLPYKAKRILIGIPYTFELETLNFENTSSIGLNKV